MPLSVFACFCVSPFFLFSQWCGHAEGQEGELSERFLDFVSNKWRNRAYQSLARSFICIRGFAFCKPEHEVTNNSVVVSA